LRRIESSDVDGNQVARVNLELFDFGFCFALKERTHGVDDEPCFPLFIIFILTLPREIVSECK